MAKLSILKEENSQLKSLCEQRSPQSEIPELINQITKLKEKVFYLQEELDHGVKFRDVYDNLTSVHSDCDTTPRRPERQNTSMSESGSNRNVYVSSGSVD